MSGFKVFSSGLDLDDIFSTRIETDPSYTSLVPFVTPSDQNLSLRYLPYTTGTKASVTGFKFYDASGVMKDLCDIFAPPPYAYTRANPSSVTERIRINGGVTYVSLTFLSMDTSYAYIGITTPTISNAGSSTYNAGTFTVNDNNKIKDLKIVLVSGGGGAGCATTNSAAGGGGGAVHIVDASFVNNTRLNVNVGNGGIGAFFSNTNTTGYPASRGGESRVNVASGTAIINNVNYTSGQFYTAGNSGWAGPYGTGTGGTTDISFNLRSNSPRGAGAGSGGGGGAHSNLRGVGVAGGASNSGSVGGGATSPNTTAQYAQPSGGGGGGGFGLATNFNYAIANNAIPSVFTGNGEGDNGKQITHNIFGNTYYGGGGGAAQPASNNSSAGSGFLMAAPGGAGGGGDAFRNVVSISNANGGSGTNGLGGGGGGVTSPASGTYTRNGGNGGHGTVVINFRLA
jgi:hypothetical protein